ncbi:ATPase, T2SS/T4P/T4SS family, partial [Streptomyces scabiei]
SQRLVRTLCDSCKEAHVADERECELLGVASDNPPTIYRAMGCEECNFNGYRGRTGIHELLVVDETVRELVHSGKGEQSVEKYIRKHTPSI